MGEKERTRPNTMAELTSVEHTAISFLALKIALHNMYTMGENTTYTTQRRQRSYNLHTNTKIFNKE